MISLNLLPPQAKFDSNLKWNYLIIKNVILMILVVTLAISMVLFSAKLTLRKKLAEAEIQLNRINITRNQANKEIRLTNQLITELQTAQAGFLPWSSVIWNFLETITPGIQIDSIRLSKATQTITVKGMADTRDNLLRFKDNLSSHSMITHVDLPLTNLLSKTAIDFTITTQFAVNDDILYE